MKRKDFFDNLNVVFANKEEDEEYAFTKAVVYRNLETGEIDSVQIVNTEYREFLVIDRDGAIDVISMDESEADGLLGDKKNDKKRKKK